MKLISTAMLICVLLGGSTLVGATDYVIDSSTVNIRSGPGKTYSIVVKLQKGDRVTGVAARDGWTRIRAASGMEGWVADWLLKPASRALRRASVISDSRGINVGGYAQSHALLIGVSDYTAGWPDLESIPAELKRVESSLVANGFKVTKVINPNSRQLKSTYEKFIDDYGFNEENRLLFYYSGHGHTMNNGRKGYLVPADAPNPDKDARGFKRRALDMNQILSWSRQMDAKHALFLFDSCFSGTIFKQRDLPRQPPHISALTAKPVRQFITAGSAGETVPANSVFTPVFIDALDYGLGDLNRDGYVSGTELGLYLQEKVPHHTQQTPQYGKITDYELSRGDFIFFTGKKTQIAGGAFVQERPRRSRHPNNPTVGAATASAMVKTVPSGASIWLDGQQVGVSPVEIKRTPGSVEIEARLQGYDSVRQRVRLRTNKEQQLTLLLDKVRPTKIRLTSKIDKVSWYLDGAFMGQLPDEVEVSPGKHTVTMQGGGMARETKTVEVEKGQTIELQYFTASLQLSSNVEGAEWRLNGEAMGGVPTQPVDVTPGQHVVEVFKPGYRAWRDSIDVAASKSMRIAAVLSRVASAVKPASVSSWQNLYEKVTQDFDQYKFAGLKIKAPDIAENGAVVPVTAELEADGKGSIYIFVNNNPSPFAGQFKYLDSVHKAYVSTRIKMAKSGDIIVVYVSENGRILVNKKSIRILIS